MWFFYALCQVLSWAQQVPAVGLKCVHAFGAKTAEPFHLSGQAAAVPTSRAAQGLRVQSAVVYTDCPALRPEATRRHTELPSADPACVSVYVLLQVVAGFAENQQYGLGTNSMTGEQKSLLIYGALALFFILFLGGAG